MVVLHYFAKFRDLSGRAQESLACGEMTVGQILERLIQTYPEFEGETIHVAINEEYANREHIIKSGDVVALIPPVSGG